MDKDTQVIQARKEKINAIREKGVPLYPNDFKISCSAAQLRTIIETDPSSLGEDGRTFRLAGRMMAINKMGKSSFVRFKDGSDQMQVYVQKTKSGMRLTTCSKNWTSEILSVSLVLYFRPKPENGPSWPWNSGFCPKPCGLCRKSFTESRIPKNGIGNGIWI